MNETPHIGMDQLAYFVGMIKIYLDSNDQEHFWSQIRENCPDLMQAIEASFKSVYGWDTITFTRNICSPAFDLNLVEADQERTL